jgi:acetolactate synthase-1/2/3 large subunit
VTAPRTGAYALLQAAHAFGARVCFANPGTTELALVSALDDVPGIRPILGLFEGVCTGAADGYGRICGSPALTLLHLGPGLANGLANLHNARRAHSPIINIVGDHASWHLPYDAPLTSDIEMLARPMSSTVIRVDAPERIREAVRQAFERSLAPPGSVATLIVPTDAMEAPAADLDSQAEPVPRIPREEVSEERIVEVARRLAHKRAVLLLGADALGERGQRAASRIAAMTGARLMMESYPAIVALGGDLARLERMAYFPEDVRSQLSDDVVVLAGARAPVSYFGYPGQPSELVAQNRLALLASAGEDSALALEHLAEEVTRSARATRPSPPVPADETRSESSLTPGGLARELVARLPEGAIVSLEGSTCGAPYLKQAHRARRHWVMTNTGGAIGQGIPCGLGAAIARPDSRVVCLQSDGSAQYTVQALWTMAREALDVTVIICANHRYGILQTELRRAGVSLDGRASAHMTRLDAPRVDWVSLGRAYGVPGIRVETAEEFRDALGASLHAPGPMLIECQLP